MGGLPRREGYWQALLRSLPAGAEPPVLVDLGNNFPPLSAQGKLKIDVIQSFLGKLPVAAILPGPNELQAGYATLDRHLPYLITNNDAPGGFLPYRTVGQSGTRVLIAGYLSPALVYQGSQEHFRLVPLDAALRRYEALVQQERAAYTLLLFRGDEAELGRLASSGLFTAIVAGNPSDDELKAATEWAVAGYRVPEVPTKGQGAVRLPAGASGPVRVDWLKEGIPEGPEARAALAAYDDRVQALFFAQAEAREALAKDTVYAGAQACQGCHPSAFATWQGSRHARALHGLEIVRKQFDPECLACHVVGLDRTGFVSVEATPHLAGVQCENCHGPARAHVSNPGKATPPAAWRKEGPAKAEATCRTCHHGSHSPKFDFARYWPRIRHGAGTASN